MPPAGQRLTPNLTTHRNPEEEAEYERIWQGSAGGVSENDVRANHARHEQILQLLRSKDLSPGAVIPSAFKQSPEQRQIAVDSVAALLRADEEALETRGRSVPQNRYLVRRRVTSAATPRGRL